MVGAVAFASQSEQQRFVTECSSSMDRKDRNGRVHRWKTVSASLGREEEEEGGGEVGMDGWEGVRLGQGLREQGRGKGGRERGS